MRSSPLILALLLAAACTPPGATPVCSPSASYTAPAMKCGGSSAGAVPGSDTDTAAAGGDEAGGKTAAKPEVAPEPPPPPPPPPPPKVEVKQDTVELADPVEFDGDTAKLSDNGKALLDDVASELASHPEVQKLRIEGHAEGGGNAAAKKKSLKLATQRAAAVKTYLVSKGVAAARLTTKAVPAGKTDLGGGIQLHIAKRK